MVPHQLLLTVSAIPSLVAGTASLTPHVSPTSWNNPGLIHGQQNSILPARLESSSRGEVAAAASLVPVQAGEGGALQVLLNCYVL